MSFVTLRGLSKSFGESRIFQDIDLDIEQGSICVLVGPSGCGKTTLLRAVAGLTRPDHGNVTIDGKDITHAEPKERGIGMVFQHYALFPNLTVEQNLAFGLEQMRLPPAVIAKKIAAMIELMGLGPRAKARPAMLSGGQKQRVALARALVLEPKLLLLDEPLSALDAQIRKRLRDELKRLQYEIGFTAIFVTHDQEEALLLGDKIGVMQQGRFEQVGTPSEIYNRPGSLSVARFIGDFNILAPHDIGVLFDRRTDLNWAVHPQALEIVKAPTKKQLNGSFYATQATITTEHILGTVIRYTANSHGQTLKVDVLNTPELIRLKVGDSVWLRVSRANLCELPS